MEKKFLKVGKSVNFKFNTEGLECDLTPGMVYSIDVDMHEIKRWNSAAEAAKYYNIQAANICACCTYRRNHCAGFKWRYFI